MVFVMFLILVLVVCKFALPRGGDEVITRAGEVVAVEVGATVEAETALDPCPAREASASRQIHLDTAWRSSRCVHHSLRQSCNDSAF